MREAAAAPFPAHLPITFLVPSGIMQSRVGDLGDHLSRLRSSAKSVCAKCTAEVDGQRSVHTQTEWAEAEDDATEAGGKPHLAQSSGLPFHRAQSAEMFQKEHAKNAAGKVSPGAAGSN